MLMRAKTVTDSLDSLASLALHASDAYDGGTGYERLSDDHCDGFQIRIGRVPKEGAVKHKSVLMSSMHSMDSEFIVKNLLF